MAPGSEIAKFVRVSITCPIVPLPIELSLLTCTMAGLDLHAVNTGPLPHAGSCLGAGRRLRNVPDGGIDDEAAGQLLKGRVGRDRPQP